MDKVVLQPIDRAAVDQLRRCRCLPGTFARRFARSLAEQLAAGDARVSRRQLYILWKVCWQHRHRLKGEVQAELIRRRESPRRDGWVQG